MKERPDPGGLGFYIGGGGLDFPGMVFKIYYAKYHKIYTHVKIKS